MGQVGAGEADAAHRVDFEEAEPVGIGDVFEGLGLVDPEVVDEDVYGGELRQEFGDALFGAEVGGDAAEVRRAAGGDGGIYALLGASVEDDVGAFGGEALGDGESDACGGAGDECSFAAELEIHSEFRFA